jgi:hypothetical protein
VERQASEFPESSGFPMTVKQFLSEAELHLKRGDIVLSRSNTLVSLLIRWATESTFSHSALVFLVPRMDDGFLNTFVLESDTRGVGLANLRSYIAGRSPSAQIAVLRLEGEGLNEDFFKQARGLMLDHVKAGYDYEKVWFQFLELVFGLKLAGSRLRLGGRKSMRDAVSATRTRRVANWVPPQFICSGFIQFGLVQSARRLGIDVERVILRDGVSETDRHGLLATSPEDIARSSKLKWLFVVRRGFVHRVASYDEAKGKF